MSKNDNENIMKCQWARMATVGLGSTGTSTRCTVAKSILIMTSLHHHYDQVCAEIRASTYDVKKHFKNVNLQFVKWVILSLI